MIFAYFFQSLTFSTTQTVWPLLLQNNFNEGDKLGFILMGAGIILIIILGGLIGKLTAKFGKHLIATVGSIIMGTAMILYGYSTNFAVHLVFLNCHFVGQALLQSTTPSLISAYTPPEMQVTHNTTYTVFFFFMSLFCFFGMFFLFAKKMK